MTFVKFAAYHKHFENENSSTASQSLDQNLFWYLYKRNYSANSIKCQS